MRGKKKQIFSRYKTKFLGFTLVELIVVIAIVLIVLPGFYISINPIQQLNKAYDSQRVADLSTIASALDTYYNDHSAYPQTITFGQKWKNGASDYMEKVPNDPQLQTNGSYCYMSDTSQAPQWNVLFSKLVRKQSSKKCNLADTCLPNGYTQQWVCKVSGKVDCKILSKYSLPCSNPKPTSPPTLVPITTPQTPDPRYAGVCELRDVFASSPNATAIDIAIGYAKLTKPGSYTITQLRSACNNQQDYQTLMKKYCSINKYPAQYEVEEFSNGQRIGVSWDSPYSTGCVVDTPVGCCFHSCSNGFACSSSPATP